MVVKSNYKQRDSYLVPVGDLLHKQWSSDSLTIDHIILEWYAFDYCKVTFTALSDNEIVMQLPSFDYYDIDCVCDYCGSSMNDIVVSTKPEIVHFMLYFDQIDLKDQEQYDFIYKIYSDRNIDIAPALRASILLSKKLQYICDSCSKLQQETNNAYQSSHASSSLIFTKKKSIWK